MSSGLDDSVLSSAAKRVLLSRIPQWAEEQSGPYRLDLDLLQIANDERELFLDERPALSIPGMRPAAVPLAPDVLFQDTLAKEMATWDVENGNIDEVVKTIYYFYLLNDSAFVVYSEARGY